MIETKIKKTELEKLILQKESDKLKEIEKQSIDIKNDISILEESLLDLCKRYFDDEITGNKLSKEEFMSKKEKLNLLLDQKKEELEYSEETIDSIKSKGIIITKELKQLEELGVVSALSESLIENLIEKILIFNDNIFEIIWKITS